MEKLDKILERYFNEGMYGVRHSYWNGTKLERLTYDKWKKDYPSLYNVIIKSMTEVLGNNKNALTGQELNIEL